MYEPLTKFNLELKQQCSLATTNCFQRTKNICVHRSTYVPSSERGVVSRRAPPPQYVRNPYYVVLTIYYLLVTDLGVISPHFEWQSNRKQVRPLEGASKKRFQTLRPSLEKSGGVLKLEPFFFLVDGRRVYFAVEENYLE